MSEVGGSEAFKDEGVGVTEGLVVGVATEQVRPGDCLLVLPGETIPVDVSVSLMNCVGIQENNVGVVH